MYYPKDKSDETIQEIKLRLERSMREEVRQRQRELSLMSSAALFSFQRRPEPQVSAALVQEIRGEGG